VPTNVRQKSNICGVFLLRDKFFLDIWH